MSNAETLKSMLQSIINGREEEAAVSLHEYFVSKTREVTGLSEAELSEEEVDEILESATEEELDEVLSSGWAKDVAGGHAYTGNGLVQPQDRSERKRLAAQIGVNRADRKAASAYFKTQSDSLSQKAGESDETFAKRKEWAARSAREASYNARGAKSAAPLRGGLKQIDAQRREVTAATNTGPQR